MFDAAGDEDLSFERGDEKENETIHHQASTGKTLQYIAAKHCCGNSHTTSKIAKFSNNGITVFIFVGNAHDIPQLDLSKVSAAIVEEDEASTTRSSLSE